MIFSDIVGQNSIKKMLLQSVEDQRLPQAYIFDGASGLGGLPMARALAGQIICSNQSLPLPGRESCNESCAKLLHPDLHFVFPMISNPQVKGQSTSDSIMETFRAFVLKHPYASLFDWYRYLDNSSKQGLIGVKEAERIQKILSLKSHQGGYRVIVIWQADLMNKETSNKMLKLLEEASGVLFVLISENALKLLPTIRSRCQIIHFPQISETEIKQKLESITVDTVKAQRLAHQAEGNFGKALRLLYNDSASKEFERLFIDWMRLAFLAKTNKKAALDLTEWSKNIATHGREFQKNFLGFALELFRQALLLNYELSSLVSYQSSTPGFKLEKMAPFIHGRNIIKLQKEMEKALFHIERNANARVVFTDLSINVTRQLHVR